MDVILMRHGIAVDRLDPDCPADAERPLTPKGVRRTRAAARGLRTLGVAPDVILTSPLVRAAQTAAIVAEALDCTDVRRTSALAGGTETDAAFAALADLAPATVLCTGHAPQLDVLLGDALGAPDPRVDRLKKAGAAGVRFEGAVVPGGAELLWFRTPKALRRAGRD